MDVLDLISVAGAGKFALAQARGTVSLGTESTHLGGISLGLSLTSNFVIKSHSLSTVQYVSVNQIWLQVHQEFARACLPFWVMPSEKRKLSWNYWQSCENLIWWRVIVLLITCLYCPASRTTLVARRFRVAAICPIIQVPHCIRVFFYFVWFVFINHIFQFYYELCTYCNILDIYLS